MAEKSTLLLRLVALTIYTSLGSLVFSYIEMKRISKEEQKEKIVHGISVLLKKQSCSGNLSETKIQAFVKQFLDEMNHEGKERWRFQDGLTFSFELLTTIGYGTTPPITQTGRLLSVFYAIFGIPLFLLVLKGWGELINKLITKAVVTAEKRFFKKEHPQNIKGKVLCVFAISMVLCILLVAVKIYSFPKHGKPTYIDSLYVLFMTFATVGFGDITFVEGSEGIPVTLLGLTLVSTIINAISVWLENRGADTCNKCFKGNASNSVCGGSNHSNRTAEVARDPEGTGESAESEKANVPSKVHSTVL